MLGLAAFGPIGIAAAAIGTVGMVAYGAFKDDETITYSDRNEKKYEAREEVKIEKNNKTYQEIQSYKKKQIKRLKDKYNIDIEFNSATIGGSYKHLKTAEKIKVNKTQEVDTISMLEDETDELIKLIGILEVEKHETTS
ncbi:hypothetical protein CRU96_02650 [Malaciobacter halophilus]|nr:hypothetical protein [Malaciobacter halophilus]RYA24551.1 hypothetical protein CRU96_02650 [Malaciobacter halophilus]